VLPEFSGLADLPDDPAGLLQPRETTTSRGDRETNRHQDEKAHTHARSTHAHLPDHRK
jgi:hypothetical protein